MSNWRKFSRATLGCFAERLHGTDLISSKDKSHVWSMYAQVIGDVSDKYLDFLDAWDTNLQCRRYGDEIRNLPLASTDKEKALYRYLELVGGMKYQPGTYTDDYITGAVEILKAMGITEADVKIFRDKGRLYD